MPPAESARHWRLGASHKAHSTSTLSRPDRGWARSTCKRTRTDHEPCPETRADDPADAAERVCAALDQQTLQAAAETVWMPQAALGQRERVELQGEIAKPRLRHPTKTHEAEHPS